MPRMILDDFFDPGMDQRNVGYIGWRAVGVGIKLAVISLLLLGIMVLAGCDDRKCLKSHNETRMISMIDVGGVMIPQYDNVEVCDQYAPPAKEGQ